MTARKLRGRRLALAGGLALSLLLTLLLAARPAWLARIDLLVHDQLLAVRADLPRESRTLTVDIDEASLAALGQWPWPRYRVAALVERLHALGAQVVALDLLMPEPDRSAPAVVAQERNRDLGEPLPAGPSTTVDDNTGRLAVALAAGPTVLACQLDDLRHARRADPMATPSGLLLTQSASVRLPSSPGVLRSQPALTRKADAEGFTNAWPDSDGTVRRLPLWRRIQGAEGVDVPAFGLAALLSASAQRRLELRDTDAGLRLRWNGRDIPLDARGALLLDFRRAPVPSESARAVLAGEVPAERVRGRIVLVGARAAGLGDHHVAPSGRAMAGLDFHATLIDGIAAGAFITRPDWATALEPLSTLAAGLLTTLLMLWRRPGLSLPAIAALGVALPAGSALLLRGYGILLSPLGPAAAVALTTGAIAALRYAAEARRARLRTREMLLAQDAAILAMASLAETRDNDTGNHIRRTQHYVRALALRLRDNPRHRAQLSDVFIDNLFKSAPLHDIGKVGIPDRVLLKADRLTPDEFALMQTHTTLGHDAILRAEQALGVSLPFLQTARELTRSHQEKWDGSGYPQGLAGEAIPLSARLMAVADVYDALISRRVYKAPLTHAAAVDAIRRGAGSHFDPDVVAAFEAAEAAFSAIAQGYPDAAPDETAAPRQPAPTTAPRN